MGKISSYKGIDPSNPSSYVPPFDFYSIQVEPKYFYKGFQFRFVNYNYRLGVYSTWHLDYVKLVANQIPTKNQMDIAFTTPPNGLLKHIHPFHSANLPDLKLLNWQIKQRFACLIIS